MKRKNKIKLIVVSLILIAPCLTSVKANTTKNNEATQDHNPILFLHGYSKNWMDWYPMMVWFKDDGWPNTTNFYAGYAYDFDDTYNCSVQANINNAHKIKQWVDDILNETGYEKIDLVGHSMGGISSRYYIKFLGGIDTVDDYVSLGSSHHGGWCDATMRPLILSLNEGDETPGGILSDTLGDRIDPISGDIYNSTHIPGTINYTSIYSRDDEIVPYISSPLDGVHNIEVEKLLHSQLLSDESVYELVKAAVDDSLPNGTSTTTLTSTTTTTTNTTTTMTTTKEAPLTLIPVVFTMSLMALIVIHQRRPKTIIKIKRNRK